MWDIRVTDKMQGLGFHKISKDFIGLVGCLLSHLQTLET